LRFEKTPPALAAWSLNVDLPNRLLLIDAVSIASAWKTNLSGPIQDHVPRAGNRNCELEGGDHVDRLKLRLHAAKAGGVFANLN